MDARVEVLLGRDPEGFGPGADLKHFDRGVIVDFVEIVNYRNKILIDSNKNKFNLLFLRF